MLGSPEHQLKIQIIFLQPMCHKLQLLLQFKYLAWLTKLAYQGAYWLFDAHGLHVLLLRDLWRR